MSLTQFHNWRSRRARALLTAWTLLRALLATLILWPAPAGAQVNLSEQSGAVELHSTHQAVEACNPTQGWQTGGLAVGDFNLDGWLDLFVLSLNLISNYTLHFSSSCFCCLFIRIRTCNNYTTK